ncbi:MAG: MFS transporter [Proteobacteria bacterium]|nr:MFS transporter [Pseudomonadota bacterium]
MHNQRILCRAVVVAALGYFVDIFDILLFSIVRVQSLTDLGLDGDAILTEGMRLLRTQMLGMLLGGVIWGVIADKRGRVTVLFGSIITYSIATFLNGFVQNVWQYEVLRFIGGIGLAGELGAGITLVTESLEKHRRGLGTMLVASFGVSGAVAAGILAEFVGWRECYLIGGALGFLLLFLRVASLESTLYQKTLAGGVVTGSLILLFSTRERAMRFIRCVTLGLPAWYTIGILITLAPEFGRVVGMTELPRAGLAVMYAYAGSVIGDLACGLLSQLLQSRKKALSVFYAFSAVIVVVYLLPHGSGPQTFYWLCGLLGFGVGCWAIFITTAAEQFGTNLRGTVATSAPNFARGGLVPLSLLFESLKPGLGLLGSAAAVGAMTLGLAFLALAFTKESFATDLDYVER